MVHEFAARKDLERHQPCRPTFSHAPPDCKCFRKVVVVHSSPFFEGRNIAFGGPDEWGVSVDRPPVASASAHLAYVMQPVN